MDLFESIRELGWGVEIFAVVTITLLVRYIAMHMLKILGKQLEKTQNVWDDAFLEASSKPVSWFILIFGLLWAVQISAGYLAAELFSANNLELVRPLTFITLIM